MDEERSRDGYRKVKRWIKKGQEMDKESKMLAKEKEKRGANLFCENCPK